jgi:hypothetical protein
MLSYAASTNHITRSICHSAHSAMETFQEENPTKEKKMKVSFHSTMFGTNEAFTDTLSPYICVLCS